MKNIVQRRAEWTKEMFIGKINKERKSQSICKAKLKQRSPQIDIDDSV